MFIQIGNLMREFQMESGTKEIQSKQELEANPENEWAIPKLEPAINFPGLFYNSFIIK